MQPRHYVLAHPIEAPHAQYTCQDSQSIKFRMQQWTGIPSVSPQSKKNPYLLLHPENGPLPLLLVVAQDHLS